MQVFPPNPGPYWNTSICLEILAPLLVARFEGVEEPGGPELAHRLLDEGVDGPVLLPPPSLADGDQVEAALHPVDEVGGAEAVVPQVDSKVGGQLLAPGAGRGQEWQQEIQFKLFWNFVEQSLCFEKWNQYIGFHNWDWFISKA